MKAYPSDIKELDNILGGGLPSNRAYMILGVPHTGKRLFALLIQKASLLRNEYCLYVTYGQTYKSVMNRYKDIGIDPEKYMESGLLKITDYYSLNDMEIDEIRNQLSPIEKKSIVFMKPEDLEDKKKHKEYIEFQKESINKIGKPGIVIIDSLNERLERTPHKIVLKQFQIFKDRLSIEKGLLSLHLYSPINEDLSSIAEMFYYYEENCIELRTTPEEERQIRLKIKMPPIIDHSWHTFEMSKNEIKVKKRIKKSDEPMVGKEEKINSQGGQIITGGTHFWGDSFIKGDQINFGGNQYNILKDNKEQILSLIVNIVKSNESNDDIIKKLSKINEKFVQRADISQKDITEGIKTGLKSEVKNLKKRSKLKELAGQIGISLSGSLLGAAIYQGILLVLGSG